MTRNNYEGICIGGPKDRHHITATRNQFSIPDPKCVPAAAIIAAAGDENLTPINRWIDAHCVYTHRLVGIGGTVLRFWAPQDIDTGQALKRSLEHYENSRATPKGSI